jgi:hypothetical protein
MARGSAKSDILSGVGMNIISPFGVERQAKLTPKQTANREQYKMTAGSLGPIVSRTPMLDVVKFMNENKGSSLKDILSPGDDVGANHRVVSVGRQGFTIKRDKPADSPVEKVRLVRRPGDPDFAYLRRTGYPGFVVVGTSGQVL